MKKFHALIFVFLAMATAADAKPYNETADAKRDIQQAVASGKTPVIVVFGANWCGDCKKLAAVMKSGPTASLLARDFQIVKVNVGHLDTNLDIVQSYGVSLDKGIPVIVILSTNNTVLYATREGELSDAESMGKRGIYDFFKRVVASTPH
jgi:protein disulfide-isomerase